MKIVHFDCHPFDTKHLSAPDTEVYTYTTPFDPANAFDAVIVSIFVDSKITREDIAKMPNLRLIICRSVGIDAVDSAACSERSIIIKNIPSYGPNSVAEATFALILALYKKLKLSRDLIARGDPDSESLMGEEIYGKTIGIVGLGQIGRSVARISSGFGLNIISYDPYITDHEEYTMVDIDTLLEKSDIVSLHIPLTENNKNICNKQWFDKMKEGTYFINTSRGGLVDGTALLEALDNGKLKGVGLDVLEDDTGFCLGGTGRDMCINISSFPNVFLTPHNAYNTNEARMRIIDQTLDIIANFK
jgi:D-lactate dehydrogenase